MAADLPVSVNSRMRKVTFEDAVCLDLDFVLGDPPRAGWELCRRGVVNLEGLDTMVQNADTSSSSWKLVHLYCAEVFARQVSRDLVAAREVPRT